MITPDTSPNLPAPLVLADHPALDLLNTKMMVKGQICDLLTGNEDAARWLGTIQFDSSGELPAGGHGRLLGELRALRDCVELLVAARSENRVADPSTLNAFLRHVAPQLVWEQPGQPLLERFREPDAAKKKLGQIAFAAAQLLAEGDFNLVRKCENPECSLMFYDRTKSHKRRWCSMALCGNRHKVAEFRKRRQDAVC